MNCKDCEYFANGSCHVVIYDGGQKFGGIDTEADAETCRLFTERSGHAVSG